MESREKLIYEITYICVLLVQMKCKYEKVTVIYRLLRNVILNIQSKLTL